MEIHGGLLFAPEGSPLWLKVGAGPGITHGFGAPDLRVYAQAGLSWAWRDEPPEPPADRDGDGLLDAADTCPDEPEDRDRFEDGDGCPDPDNDGDAVFDVDDRCPLDPEDEDGFEDEDGCVDPDNDGDGIVDTRDECPDEPEVVNEYKDADGCPDEKLVEVTEKEIVILDKVYFDLDKATLRTESFAVLDAVAEAMQAHPQIKLVEVQGHTDSRGSAAHNRELSAARAAAVRDYLIEKGVEGARLKSHGYGESIPIVPDPKTEDGHGRNRRVQFIILEMEPGGPEVRSTPAP